MHITEILTKLLGLSDVQSGDTPEQPEIPGENATPEEIINYLINSGLIKGVYVTGKQYSLSKNLTPSPTDFTSI